MRTFAIDTSTSVATAAIIEEGNVVGVVTVNMNKPHSQKIMPVAESLFKLAELSPKDIDLFAAARGPGSFTGLRIGISAVLGFSDALNVPCVGVSTLEALAYPHFNKDVYVCPVIDAKRDRVYCAIYKSGEVIQQPECCNVDDVLAKCKELDGKIIFTGDFVPFNKERIMNVLKDVAIIDDEIYCHSNALSVAKIAEKMYKSGNCDKIEPEYVLKSYVEELEK